MNQEFLKYLQDRIESLTKTHGKLKCNESHAQEEQQSLALNTQAAGIWDVISELNQVLATYNQLHK